MTNATFTPANDNFYAVTRRIDFHLSGATEVTENTLGVSTYVPDHIVGNIEARPGGIFGFDLHLFCAGGGPAEYKIEGMGHVGTENIVLMPSVPIPTWLIEPLRTWVRETYAYGVVSNADGTPAPAVKAHCGG